MLIVADPEILFGLGGGGMKHEISASTCGGHLLFSFNFSLFLKSYRFLGKKIGHYRYHLDLLVMKYA